MENNHYEKLDNQQYFEIFYSWYVADLEPKWNISFGDLDDLQEVYESTEKYPGDFKKTYMQSYNRQYYGVSGTAENFATGDIELESGKDIFVYDDIANNEIDNYFEDLDFSNSFYI